MKKLFFVSLLLTTVIAAQAQLKITPKMEKGIVKTYVNTITTSIPMQGDVTITSETNYSVVDATADGYLVDVETINVKVDADADNITGKLLAATEELQKGTVIHLSNCLLPLRNCRRAPSSTFPPTRMANPSEYSMPTS